MAIAIRIQGFGVNNNSVLVGQTQNRERKQVTVDVRTLKALISRITWGNANASHITFNRETQMWAIRMGQDRIRQVFLLDDALYQQVKAATDDRHMRPSKPVPAREEFVRLAKLLGHSIPVDRVTRLPKLTAEDEAKLRAAEAAVEQQPKLLEAPAAKPAKKRGRPSKKAAAAQAELAIA